MIKTVRHRSIAAAVVFSIVGCGGSEGPSTGMIIQTPTATPRQTATPVATASISAVTATATPTQTVTPSPTAFVSCVEPFTGEMLCAIGLNGYQYGNACLSEAGGQNCFSVTAHPLCCWTATVNTGGECFGGASIVSGEQGCGSSQVCFIAEPNGCEHTSAVFSIDVGGQEFRVVERFATPRPTPSN